MNHRTEGTVESDLRNALTAEKTIEPSLDWGNALKVNIADVQSPGDHNVVCLTEVSASGVTFAIADIAVGPHAGTFYGRKGCPTPLTALTVSKLTTQGWS